MKLLLSFIISVVSFGVNASVLECKATFQDANNKVNTSKIETRPYQGGHKFNQGEVIMGSVKMSVAHNLTDNRLHLKISERLGPSALPYKKDVYTDTYSNHVDNIQPGQSYYANLSNKGVRSTINCVYK